MTVRITLVLEYPSVEDVPRIGFNSKLSELGDPRIPSLQFSDALRELEYLNDRVADDLTQAASRAGYDYPGCTDPGRPRQPSDE